MRAPWSIVVIAVLLSVSAAPLVLAGPGGGGGNGNGNGGSNENGGGPPTDDGGPAPTDEGPSAGDDRDRREDVEDGDVDNAEGKHGRATPPTPQREPEPEQETQPEPEAQPQPEPEPEPEPEPQPKPKPEPQPDAASQRSDAPPREDRASPPSSSERKPDGPPTREPVEPTPKPTPANRTPERPTRATPPTPDRSDETPAAAPPHAQGQQGGVASTSADEAPIVLSSLDDAPEESTQPEVRVVRGARPLDVANGVVNVTSSYDGDASRVRLVLVHPNGTEETLARGSTDAPWDTRGHDNGRYTVELRERDDDTGDEVTLASTYVRVENPRIAVPAAIAAIATGAASSAGAAFLAARGVDLLTVLKHAGVDLTVEAAEDQVLRRTSRWDRFARQGRVAMAGLILVASLLLAAFQVWADAPRAAEFLAALPIMGSAVVLVTLSHYGLETALARVTGARSRFRLWTAGALTLAASAIIFRAPFGHPGYVEEADAPQRDADESEERQLAGLRAMAVLAGGVGLALPLALLGDAWRWDFAEAGIGTALMMASAAALPFRPLPGRDVWLWSRSAWCVAGGATVAFYFLWQAALLPLWLLEVTAGAGLVTFAFAMLRLRPAARAPAPASDTTHTS